MPRSPLARRAASLAALTLVLTASSAAQTAPPDCVSASWASAVVLIPAAPATEAESAPLAPGSRIAALAPDGSCVGVSTWTSRGAALTVWADDFMTSRTDGLRDGDPLRLVVLDDAGGALEDAAPLALRYDPTFAPGAGFEADGLYVVASDGDAPPEAAAPEVALGAPYPNPVADRARVPFTLGAEADVVLEVFDAVGRHVATLAEGRLGAGEHRAAFDAAGLSAGVYLVRLRADGAVAQGQLVVAR